MSDDTVLVMALNIRNNVWNTEFNLNCIQTQSVQRSKHFPSRL